MANRLYVLLVIAALLLTACSKAPDANERRAAETAAAAAMPPEPASLPTESALPSESADPAALPTDGAAPALPEASAGFDVASVPLTTVSLPPFPFFKDPEGLDNLLKGRDALIPFERHWFIAGQQARTEEGKLALAKYNLEYAKSGRKYSALEFHRNYENAISTLGGAIISTTQFTKEVVAGAGGTDAIKKYFYGASPTDYYEHHSFLIRTIDKEYWIHVSTGSVPLHGFVTVLEKQAMQSALAFVDAAAMKKELDANGRVALYINFDLDKATLRPDAQPTVDEINKLLLADSSLKLSIEGHTDGTGGAEHNRALATARARSVLGALVGLGVDPTRLASKGFGADKPIADNSTDQGRAKNRRVELVKIS